MPYSPGHCFADYHPRLADIDQFVPSSWEVLADIVRADGQLSVAAVDHDRQLGGPGSPVVPKGVEGGAHCSAREEHVIHDDHCPAGQVAWNVGDRLGQNWAETDVVAVEGHVQGGHRNLHLLNLG